MDDWPSGASGNRGHWRVRRGAVVTEWASQPVILRGRKRLWHHTVLTQFQRLRDIAALRRAQAR